MSAEKTYRLELTRRQLEILYSQMCAAAEPAHRCADEEAMLLLIEQAGRRARKGERLRKAL